MAKYISVKVVEVDTARRIRTGEKDCYLVVYPDGYQSYVPCEVFEQGKYVPVTDSDIRLLLNKKN